MVLTYFVLLMELMKEYLKFPMMNILTEEKDMGMNLNGAPHIIKKINTKG
jgi:hypothetical protein